MAHANVISRMGTKGFGWCFSCLLAALVTWACHDPDNAALNYYWFGTITAIGMFAFDLLPNFVVAVLLLMYYIIMGVCAPEVAFVGWTTPIPWLSMCGMLIGVLMDKTRLSRRIALFVVSRVGTTPIRLYSAFLGAGFLLNAIIPDIITVDILFMTIAGGMCEALRLDPNSRASTTLILAAFFGATISAACFLPNNTGIIGLLMVKDMGVPFTWGGFLVEQLPYQLCHALLAFAILHVFGGKALGEIISRCRASAEADLLELGKIRRVELKG